MRSPTPLIRRGITAIATVALVLPLNVQAGAAGPDPQQARSTVWQGALAGPQGTSPDVTVRQLLMVSTDAQSLRVRFSNHFGTTALILGGQARR